MSSRLGLVSYDVRDVSARTLAAWDDFATLAAATPLDRSTRLTGWRAREVIAHLGTWRDHDPMRDSVASAAAGGAGARPVPDEVNARVTAAHATATRRQLLDALARSRARVEAWADSGHQNADAPTISSLGLLPLGTLVNAGCYELAVHALDLASAGGPQPGDDLLHAGVSALVDVTGALAARQDISVHLAACTPYGSWEFSAANGGWTTQPLSGTPHGAAVRGSAADLLDASAGRAAIPKLLLLRRLKVSDLGQLMKLAAIVEDVPGLPGGVALAKAISVIGGGLGRLPLFR
ncbi:MAG: maleylpyruvate isomerase family mycothiol-dependent enzyme [Mycobacteriales bacterium]|nr:maleylpyruvate isomerase N-terminal domain-containing protein [Frankia sp.]